MGASRPQTPRCFLVLDYLFSSTGNCSSMLNLRPVPVTLQLINCPYFNVNRVVVQVAAQIDYHVDSFVVVVCL